MRKYRGFSNKQLLEELEKQCELSDIISSDDEDVHKENIELIKNEILLRME